MARLLTIDDVNVKNKVILVRVDFNSPVNPKTKSILDDTRIRAHGESTIKELAQKGAKVIVLAHQGRPGEFDFIPLKQHTRILSRILGKQVKYIDDLYGKKAKKNIGKLESGEVLVLENTRTYSGEQLSKRPEEHAKSVFIKELTPLVDIFVNDAFSVAHRSHASVVGFSTVLPSVAGRVMERELRALSRIREAQDKPCVFILGGVKADDSLEISRYVLKNSIADYVLTGGITGQLFLVAIDIDIGEPNKAFLEEHNLLSLVPYIKKLMKTNPGRIKVPVDVAVEINGKRKELATGRLPTEYPILDIGTETIKQYSHFISEAKSIVVSGPTGVYERKEFEKGTKEVLEAVAVSDAFSLVGGGHTVAAVKEFGIADKMSYISMAGGALTEFLMGKNLPGITALKKAQFKPRF